MRSKDALNKLRQIVGEELYKQIVNELSGATVYFPANYECTDKLSRNDSLIEDYYNGGYEIGDLARKYNLSISRIYKIIEHRE